MMYLMKLGESYLRVDERSKKKMKLRVKTVRKLKSVSSFLEYSSFQYFLEIKIQADILLVS